MWQIVVYAVTVAAALGVLGLCHEKLATMCGWPRRFFWACAMALSILWPAAAILWNRPPPEVAQVAPPSPPSRMQVANTQSAGIALPVSSATRNTQMAAIAAKPQFRPPSDRSLLLIWAAMTGAIVLYLAGTGFLLRRGATRWERRTILGQEVRVSENTGPALLGALRPTIVVPNWFLEETASTQSLILDHERQHIAARDPLLLRLALLAVVAVPWNLPLWWQLRRLRQAIELDCDARVLRRGADADCYGKVLLAVTQRNGNMPVAAVAMSEPVSALERRIRNLSAGPARHRKPLVLATLALWGAGVGVAASLDAPAMPAAPAIASAAAGSPAPATRPVPETAAATGAVAGVVNRVPASRAMAAGQSSPGEWAGRQQPHTSAQGAAAPSEKAVDATMLRVAAEQKLEVLRERTNDNHPDNIAQIKIIEELRREEERAFARLRAQAAVASLSTPQASLAAAAPDANAPLRATPAASDEMDLRELITIAGRKFRKRFVVNPRVVGTADLGTLNPESLTYHAFLEILGVHGFVAVPSGDVVTIMPEQFARTFATPIVPADDIQGDDAEVVTVLLSLASYQPAGKEGTKAAELAASMRSLVSASGQISTTPDGNFLLVVDRVGNVKRIVALVKSLSKPQ